MRSRQGATNNADVKRFYRWQAPIYDETRWLTLRGRQAAIGSLSLRPGESVLDLGCGTGLSFGLIRDRIGADGTIVGVDASPHMLHRARRRIGRKAWSNVQLVEQDLSALNLERRFDALAFIYSLSMIDNWETAVQRAAEHLTASGRLVVLDFGNMRTWGASALFVRWLRANHTEPGRPYVSLLRRYFREVSEMEGVLGYTQLVVAASRIG